MLGLKAQHQVGQIGLEIEARRELFEKSLRRRQKRAERDFKPWLNGPLFRMIESRQVRDVHVRELNSGIRRDPVYQDYLIQIAHVLFGHYVEDALYGFFRLLGEFYCRFVLYFNRQL
jgi:hypothetical protein